MYAAIHGLRGRFNLQILLWSKTSSLGCTTKYFVDEKRLLQVHDMSVTQLLCSKGSAISETTTLL
jgi:hypothetical protein